jgi:hypothetical protein
MSELIEKLKVYLIILTDQGDTKIKVVDQETWDWINSDDLGRHPNLEGASSWTDLLVPQSQLKKILDDNNGYHPHLTIGSWQNDRAMWSCNADGYVEGYYGSVEDAMEAIEKNGHELTDEYHGSIY